MSSNAYATPLRLAPQPSRILERLLVVALLGAALLPFTVLPLLVALACLGPAAWLARRAWRRHFGPERVAAALWRGDGRWELEWESGACEADLEGDSYLSARVVVLNLRCDDGARRTLVLLPDSLDRESFRQLRVRLRLEGWRRTATGS